MVSLLNYVSAQSRLSVLHLQVQIHQLQHPEDEFIKRDDVVSTLNQLDKERMDTYHQFGAEMELIYATSSFDTFLSDVTRVCIMSLPRLFLKSKSIAVSYVLGPNLVETLNQAVNELLREISRKSFQERISYLSDKLGVKFQIPEGDLAVLREWSQVRNALMHDRSITELRFSDKLKPKIIRKPPTKAVVFDRDKAVRAHISVMKMISAEVSSLCEDGAMKVECLKVSNSIKSDYLTAHLI